MSVEKKFKETQIVFAAVAITHRGPDLNVRFSLPRTLPNDTVSNTSSIQMGIDECDQRARYLENVADSQEFPSMFLAHVEIDSLAVQVYFSGRRYPLPEPLRLPSKYHLLKTLQLDSVALGDRTEFLADLPDLERLCIDNCELTRVPPQLEHMKKLERVEFALNSITHIPLFMGYMPKLDSVMLEEEEHLVHAELPLSFRGIPYLFVDRFKLPSPILRRQHRLGSLLLNGLVEADRGIQTPWTAFLRRGMYDPRLFLHIWAFCTTIGKE